MPMATQVASTMGRAMHLGDLRRRVLYTVIMFAVFRLGVHVPVPGINQAALATLFKPGTFFGLLNLFAGGALSVFAVFAMGVTPYINASIIMQLLTLVIPQVEAWQKEGPEGQKQINQWTRYGTVLLGLIQAVALAFYLKNGGGLLHPGLASVGVVVVVLTGGTLLLMWIGEQITEYGIGNGISLLIMAGIISRVPAGVGNIVTYVSHGTVSWWNLLLFAVLAVAVIAAVVAVTQAALRVPVQYAKRVVGRRMYGGASSYIPIRVNQAGVIPVIFAASVLTVPLTLTSFTSAPWLTKIAAFFANGGVMYELIYAALIIAFTFFYTSIVWNPNDVADNIKKYGGFIPGLRPGRPTADYLSRVLERVTVLGAIFLAAIAVLPVVFTKATNVPNIYFGGTALLIVVGVALDTMMQIEGHMLMRHYQGFIR
jgi:preprotein translocase subunit SecY